MYWEQDSSGRGMRVSLTIDFLECSSRFLAYFYGLRCNYLGLFLLTMYAHHLLSADTSKWKAILRGERHQT